MRCLALADALFAERWRCVFSVNAEAIDIVPALLFGPIGLLDDLFVVAACLSRLLNHVHPDIVRGHWSGHGDALETIQNVTGWFEKEVRMRVSDLARVLSRRRSR